MAKGSVAHRRIPTIRFKQWLKEWENYDYSTVSSKPEPYLYLFSMRAAELRRLCDVYRRKREGANAEGIQRLRDESRTSRIQRYVRYGYPYGDIRPAQRTPDTQSLRKPGWLPTAIVVNILTENDVRRGRSVDAEKIVTVEHVDDQFFLRIPPDGALDDESLAPLEVIDGQHRLWAFEDSEGGEPIPEDFELPVVAFHGLDVPLQAYLFWSINVSPKRINPSHAFDLYPLLRNQDWLDRVGELSVYREARAQELTEILYTHQESPWRDRINMLGERGGGVSQAAWVRSLISSFFATGKGAARAGLFQANVENWDAPLPWSRAQQAAFIIQTWIELQNSITKAAKREWWIRCYSSNPLRAFTDKTSMLNQDMGVRAVCATVNDVFYARAYNWRLDEWSLDQTDEGSTSPEDVSDALASLTQTNFYSRIVALADGLANFDWRSLEGPAVEGDDEVIKRSYRGSGGYTALRLDVLRKIAEEETEVGETASELVQVEEA